MVIRITYFVHGTTTDNELGLASGWSDVELSKLGIKQAKELKVNYPFDGIFSSDLRRAIQSAELSFPERMIIQDQRLRECNFGDLTNKAFNFDLKQYINKPFPNGESYMDVQKRIDNFLDFLQKNYNGKHIAIVSHQAPQLALDVLLKGKTWEQAIEEDWRNTKAWQPGWEYVVNR